MELDISHTSQAAPGQSVQAVSKVLSMSRCLRSWHPAGSQTPAAPPKQRRTVELDLTRKPQAAPNQRDYLRAASISRTSVGAASDGESASAGESSRAALAVCK